MLLLKDHLDSWPPLLPQSFYYCSRCRPAQQLNLPHHSKTCISNELGLFDVGKGRIGTFPHASCTFGKLRMLLTFCQGLLLNLLYCETALLVQSCFLRVLGVALTSSLSYFLLLVFSFFVDASNCSNKIMFHKRN